MEDSDYEPSESAMESDAASVHADLSDCEAAAGSPFDDVELSSDREMSSSQPVDDEMTSDTVVGGGQSQLPEAEPEYEEKLSVEASLEYLLTLTRKLGVPGLRGWIYEGLHFARVLGDKHTVRSFEGAAVDGAQYYGESDLAHISTWAQRLFDIADSPDTQSHPEILATGDHKNVTPYLNNLAWREGEHGGLAEQSATITILLRPEQRGVLNHLHVTFSAAPEMVALIPVPGKRRLEYNDHLLFDTPIPPPFAPFAFHKSLLPEAYERLGKALQGHEVYRVPDSGVSIPQWPTPQPSDKDLLRRHGPAGNAFEFLYNEVNRSPYALQHNIVLEMSPFQPLDGDGGLQEPDHTTEKLELKADMFLETAHGIQIYQKEGEERSRRRHSMFSPFRGFHFLCLFSKNNAYVYWIPAASIRPEWWTGAQYVHIDLADIRQFRIDISADPSLDWVGSVYERIIRPNSLSTRPDHIIPPLARAEDYAYASELKAGESSHQPDRYKSRVGYGLPVWKVERWNRVCAHAGYGLWLTLGRYASIANVVFIPYTWSVQDRKVFFAIGKLPRGLHKGDFSPHQPVLLVRGITVRRHRERFRPDFPSHVAPFRIDEGPFPCLYYIDCATYSMRAEERAGLLIPSEVIDYEFLRKKYSDDCGEATSSGREWMNKIPKKEHNMRGLPDLSTCLKAPFTEFMIREGKEFLHSIRAFFEEHAQDEKFINWFGYQDLYAKEDYVVTLAQLEQALMDEYLPKLLAGGDGRGSDDDDSEVDLGAEETDLEGGEEEWAGDDGEE